MKPRVREDRFLDWYLSEEKDFYFLGRKVYHSLKENGSYKTTIKSLFYTDCETIPAFITENFTNDEGEFNTEDCELVE